MSCPLQSYKNAYGTKFVDSTTGKAKDSEREA
jgi:hypothetical protein